MGVACSNLCNTVDTLKNHQQNHPRHTDPASSQDTQNLSSFTATMSSREYLAVALASALASSAAAAAAAAPAQPSGVHNTAAPQPHIVFALIDDWGWANWHYHNNISEVVTPNIDALAAEGIVLVSPRCPRRNVEAMITAGDFKSSPERQWQR